MKYHILLLQYHVFLKTIICIKVGPSIALGGCLVDHIITSGDSSTVAQHIYIFAIHYFIITSSQLVPIYEL